MRKVEQQVKVLIKHLTVFFLLPSKKFLQISFKIQLLETSPQTEAARCLLFSEVFSLPVHLELFAIFSYCLHFAKFVCLETAETETGMAEKSSWDQANRQQNHGVVWRNRKKIRQIIKDYLLLLTVLPLI